MRKHLLFFILALYAVAVGPAFSHNPALNGPANVNNDIMLWLDAADANGNGTSLTAGADLTTWKDKSGAGHDATVAPGNSPGVYQSNQINGKPVVRFTRISNTSGSVYVVNDVDLRAGTNPDVTIITVYKQGSLASTTQQNAVWGIDNGAWDRSFYSHSAGNDGFLSIGPGSELAEVPGGGKVGALQFVTAVYDANINNGINIGPTNGSAIYLNGKLISKFTDTTDPIEAQENLSIGRDGDDNIFNGDIAEMIAYNRKLTDCEIENINLYLSTKYGVNYTAIASHYNLPAPHTNQVSGIGMFSTDCSNGASNSASSGLLTISNPSANTTAGNFLTVGNDNGGYTADMETPPAYLTRLKQEWRVALEGTVGTVDICFDLANLGTTLPEDFNYAAENFALLIDNNSDFSDADVHVAGRSVSGSKICFSGVTLTHGAYLSLATELAPAPNKIAGSSASRKASFVKPTVIDDQITVTGQESITDARVYIEVGFKSGDRVSFTGSLPAGITQSYNANTGVLNFSGTATSEQWQEVFRGVTFITTSTDQADRTFRFVLGNFVSFIIDGKPHYYQFITNQFIWTNAKPNATTKRLFGLKGYLATVTSAAENNFIQSKLLKDGWIGGSDDVAYVNAALGTAVYADQAAVEGKWYWVTGPESGTPISVGNYTNSSRPAAVDNAFMNWAASEPNNRTGEHYMQFYSAQGGVWNDFSINPRLGYLVEFGGYRNDPVLEIEHTRTLNYYKMPRPATPELVDADGTDVLIKNNMPAITGKTEANAIVAIYLNGVMLTEVTANAEGTWNYTFPEALQDGAYAVTVTATAADSDVSNASAALNIRIDTTAPVGYAVAFNTDQINVKNFETASLQVSAAEVGTTLYYTITSSEGGMPVTGSVQVANATFNITPLDLTALKDGTLTATLYAEDKAGNKGTEVSDNVMMIMRNIASVTPLAIIHVPIRTTYSLIPLPVKVEVTYSTGTTGEVEVTWSVGTYNGMVLGQYTLAGVLTPAPMTTNLDNIAVQVIVEVDPNKVPTDITLSTTTFKPEVSPNEDLGTFTTTDPDDTEFVYQLVSGQGDSDNALFDIRGDKLYLRSNKGLSGLTQFTIWVKSTDTFGNTIEKVFTLTKEQYAKAADQLKIVNAFSPNGDGTNDTWTIPELKFYNQVEVEVFDRAGVRLFHTTNPEKGWDGKDQYGQVLKGAFFFVVQVKDINLVERGVVTIIK